MDHPSSHSAQVRARAEARARLRARAEAQLAGGNLPHDAEVDPLRMLHELQVHQIELQLQNEELANANRELDGLRVKYQSFYDEAPAGYLTLSLQGDIVELNASAMRMLRREASALIGRPMRANFAADSQPEFDALVQRAATGDLALAAEYLLIQRPAGVPMYVKAQARRQATSVLGEPLVLLVIVDVTALKFATDDVISTIKK